MPLTRLTARRRRLEAEVEELRAEVAACQRRLDWQAEEMRNIAEALLRRVERGRATSD